MDTCIDEYASFVLFNGFVDVGEVMIRSVCAEILDYLF